MNLDIVVCKCSHKIEILALVIQLYYIINALGSVDLDSLLCSLMSGFFNKINASELKMNQIHTLCK